MFKTPLILTSAALALAACGSVRQEGTTTQGGSTVPEPPKSRDVSEIELERGFSVIAFPAAPACTVLVYVANDRISVNPEPVYAQGCENSIRWKLQSDNGYMFDFVQPIRFKGFPVPTGLRCPISADGKVVLCRFDSSATGTRYLYEIKIRTSDGRVLLLDPSMINN